MEKIQVVTQDYDVSMNEREIRNGNRSCCFWFTGLPCSGKSTISNAVEQELYNIGFNTYILDGDNVRKGLNKDLNFTEEGRVENLRRIGEVAKLMCDAGLVVLAAFVSPFNKDRQLLRELMPGKFIEIFIDAPVEVCEQRDVKGMYKKARNKEISNFTGISSPYEAPMHPDLHIRTDQYTIEESVKVIVDYILPKLRLIK